MFCSHTQDKIKQLNQERLNSKSQEFYSTSLNWCHFSLMKLGSGICNELLNFSFEKLYSLIKEFLFNDKTFNLYYIIILSSKGKWEGLNHVYVDSSIKFSLVYNYMSLS